MSRKLFTVAALTSLCLICVPREVVCSSLNRLSDMELASIGQPYYDWRGGPENLLIICELLGIEADTEKLRQGMAGQVITMYRLYQAAKALLTLQ